MSVIFPVTLGVAITAFLASERSRLNRSFGSSSVSSVRGTTTVRVSVSPLNVSVPSCPV